MTLATVLTLTVAFAGPPAQEPGFGKTAPGAPADDIVQVGGFTIDVSGIRARPDAALPQNPLQPSDLGIAAVRNRLLQTPDTFQMVETIAGRQFLESQDWYLERDAPAGTIFALRKERDDIVPQVQNETALREAARQRLKQFGIRGGEIEKTLQRRLMRQDEAEGQVLPAQIHRYKTFVMRGINGVEVEGHRAVITHHVDGSLQRAWLRWPPLAPDGHRMQTELADDALVMSAFLALTEAGEIEGDVQLRFKYVPVEMPDGTVQLELVVGARLAPAEHEDYTEEAREINVAIGAF